MRVVLDTNVVVSALLFSGPISWFHDLWTGGRLSLVATTSIMREYARVLGYYKFRLTPGEVVEIMENDLLPFCETVSASEARLPHPPRDPADAEFLRAALAGKADALVTGDKDLLVLSGRYRFPIERPADFLGRLGKNPPAR